MDSEEMMKQFEIEASQRVDELTPEEKNIAKEFMASPAAAVMLKILGPNLVSSLPVDKLTEGEPADIETPTAPAGLASREMLREAPAPMPTPTPTPTTSAAAVAPARTGLAARPMQ